MSKRQTDPAKLEGAELERWYRRPVSEIEDDKRVAQQLAYDEHFGLVSAPPEGEGAAPRSSAEGWQSARMSPRAAVRPPPTAPRVGPPIGGAPAEIEGKTGGFFGAYRSTPNPRLGPAYLTDRPAPLNAVIPRVGGWFELGDGSLVRGEEVERIYAEQQRRESGADDPEPQPRIRSRDRLQDGVIPSAGELTKGERELDRTCHPHGGWEVDPGFNHYPERTRQYEARISRAPGLDYVVRNPGMSPVKFDGCAVWSPRRELLEAKGPGYEGLLARAVRGKFANLLRRSAAAQSVRQAQAAGESPIDWHVAEPGAHFYFRRVVKPYPPIRVRHTPAR